MPRQRADNKKELVRTTDAELSAASLRQRMGAGRYDKIMKSRKVGKRLSQRTVDRVATAVAKSTLSVDDAAKILRGEKALP